MFALAGSLILLSFVAPRFALVQRRVDAGERVRNAKLTAAFEGWFRAYRARKIGPDLDLLGRIVARGTAADGRRLIAVLAYEPERGHSQGYDLRRSRQLRTGLLAAMRRTDISVELQGAVLGFLEDGATVVSFPGQPIARRHRRSRLAAALLPLLGFWHARRYRPLLQSFVRGRQPRLIVAAAETLASARVPGSLSAMARSLSWLSDPADVRRVVEAMVTLARATGVPEPARQFVIGFVLRRFRDQAVPSGVREQLLPLLLAIRVKRSIPALLEELTLTHEMLNSRAAVPTGRSFYLHAVHAALAELTGFWAPASRPDAWWSFWNREKARFQVRPARREGSTGGADARPKTAAKGFFGIPVRGRRVLFIVDTSGSMKMRTSYRGGGTRLDLARREVLRAVSGMDPEVEYNVILFATTIRRLSASYRPASKPRNAALRRLLAGAVADGGTNLQVALRAGLAGKVHEMQSASKPSIDEVFVLSDGAPSTDPADILEAVGRWNVGRAARIHAVFVGAAEGVISSALSGIAHGRSLGPVAFMRRLAQDNGGRFLTVR